MRKRERGKKKSKNIHPVSSSEGQAPVRGRVSGASDTGKQAARPPTAQPRLQLRVKSEDQPEASVEGPPSAEPQLNQRRAFAQVVEVLQNFFFHFEKWERGLEFLMRKATSDSKIL